MSRNFRLFFVPPINFSTPLDLVMMMICNDSHTLFPHREFSLHIKFYFFHCLPESSFLLRRLNFVLGFCEASVEFFWWLRSFERLEMLESSKMYPDHFETNFMTSSHPLLAAVRAQSEPFLAPSRDFNYEIFDEMLNNFSISSDASHDF